VNDCGDSTVLRACFEELVATWPAPSLYTRMSALDAVFAFRLLLGRNPAQGAELTQLVECCDHITLREFLASVLASEEFSRQPRFIPPHHLLMAELTEFRFWFDTTDTEMGVKMAFSLYEPETIDFFRRVVRPGMTCWDIGAQTGFFTCLFCALAGESGRVVSYRSSSWSSMNTGFAAAQI